MPRIRVLIVDDAVVIRRLLSDLLAEDPEIEVVGTAANGEIALTKIRRLNPDLVTLDVDMPVMDGLETLGEIRKDFPKLPVIMFSSLTLRGAEVTLNALAAGASDYVTKPANVGSVVAGTQSVREELIPKIKVFCAPVLDSRSPGIQQAVAAKRRRPQRIDVVAIAVSTGGPNALDKLLPALPADFPVPLTIVQHMPPLFTRTLAQRLSSRSEISVHEAAAGDVLRKGAAWLAPGGYHMSLTRKIAAVQIHTDQSPPENSCRPSANVLFRSIAELYGPRALAVVLTGMGDDGLRGCQEIRDAGGQIIVQDEQSSVVWGMPGSVAMAGLADAILPLEQMASEIVRRVQLGRV